VPGRAPAQRAKRIDGRLPRSLIGLPQAITGAVDEDAYRSLAVRDLERGRGTGLPSGEAVAALMGTDLLREDELGLRAAGWRDETPLWLYVLLEACMRHDGERLGAVGGRIAAEVLYGVVAADPEAYLAVDPDWTPTLPARSDEFRLVDLLVPRNWPAPETRSVSPQRSPPRSKWARKKFSLPAVAIAAEALISSASAVAAAIWASL